MSGSKRNEMGKSLTSDRITVLDQLGHGLTKGQDFRGRHKRRLFVHRTVVRIDPIAGLRPCQGEGAKLDFTLAESRSEFVPIEACRSFSVAPDLAFS